MYRSSFRVCCSLLLLSFVVSGVMPSFSPRRPAAPASGRSAELLVVLAPLKSPWRRMGAGGGAMTAFFNKRSCGLPAVGVEPAVLLPLVGRGGEGRKRCCWSSSSAARWRFAGSLSLVCRISCASLLPWCGHPGDGDRWDGSWRRGICRSVRSSSSPELLAKLRRSRRRDRWAVFDAPVTFLVEGRPWAATMLRRVLPPGDMPYWRHCCFWLGAMASCCSSLLVPSGLVPGDGEVQPGWRHGLDCVSTSLLEVLYVKVQGLALYFLVVLGPVCSVQCILPFN